MSNNRDRIISALLTALACAVLVLVLAVCTLSFDPSTLRRPPRPTTAVAEMDEEFVELINPSLPHDVISGNPRPAMSPEDADAHATPAPQTGMDVDNNGPAGDPQPPVTSKVPSEVKHTPVPKETRPAGPTQEEIERRQQEEARRKANNTTKSAFAKAAEGKNNTDDRRKAQDGNSGRVSGDNPRANGTGTGTATGGWVVPKYSPVESTMTGSIRLRARIDVDGNVTSVEVIGGEPPAAANSALCNACIAEVRRHKFTRKDSAAPKEAVANITYRFR